MFSHLDLHTPDLLFLIFLGVAVRILGQNADAASPDRAFIAHSHCSAEKYPEIKVSKHMRRQESGRFLKNVTTVRIANVTRLQLEMEATFRARGHHPTICLTRRSHSQIHHMDLSHHFPHDV